MKAFENVARPAKPIAIWFPLPLAIAAAMIALASVARGADGPSKTYTLFMGADFSVGQGREFYPVRGADGDSLVIAVDGQPVLVSQRTGPVNLRVTPALKLTEVSASIANLKGEPAYTLQNDPTVKFEKSLADAEDMNAASSMQMNDAAAKMDDVEHGVSGGGQATVNMNTEGSNPAAAAAMQQSVIQATQNYNAAAALAGANVNLPLGAASQNSFDALAVTFEVSSAKPLDHAYAVISARYQDRDGVAGNWIYAKALGPIGAALKKVKIEQGGFPAGFQLQDFQVHLYNGSEEIATNVSPKRVPLTPDEAFEFVVMDYVGSHKGATLPAVPAMGKLPPDLASRIAGGEFKQTFYVKVSKDGLANDVFRDRSCVSKVDDPYLLSVVESLRFKPALENGKPVDGVAALKLGQLM